MTRALRPDGIEWPFAPDGKPANRLELLAKVNKLEHANAHDALSDVFATIELAKLIKSHQPDLFEYLRTHCGKKEAKELVSKGEPFVYSTGRYSSQFLNTSVAVLLATHPEQDAALVYDLRADPTDFLDKTPDELVEHWRFSKDPEHVPLPVKTLKYNRCPAVAPLGVLNDKAQQRIQLPLDVVRANFKVLRSHQKVFAAKVVDTLKILDAERAMAQTTLVTDERDVDSKLYDGFFSAGDKTTLAMIRAAKPSELSSLTVGGDERLRHLLPLYKARNYPTELTAEERAAWEKYCAYKLGVNGDGRLARFARRLQELAEAPTTTKKQRFLLEELQLYAESIVPIDADSDAYSDAM
jgi:exodeoxyribonuclease-1